jgi:hypothetical protein
MRCYSGYVIKVGDKVGDVVRRGDGKCVENYGRKT